MTKLIKNLARGIGSVVDLGACARGKFVIKGTFCSDGEAIRNDWQQVGKDLAQGIEQYAKPANNTK